MGAADAAGAGVPDGASLDGAAVEPGPADAPGDGVPDGAGCTGAGSIDAGLDGAVARAGPADAAGDGVPDGGGAADGAAVEEIAAILRQRDRTAIAAAIRALDAEAAAEIRWLFTSFGTCSTSEPVADLVSLGLLSKP